MSEIATRALTGAAYVALTMGAAFAGPLTTTLLFLPVCILAAYEMYRLVPGSGSRPLIVPLLVVMVAFLAVASQGMGLLPLVWAEAAILVALVAGVVELLANNRTDPIRELGMLLVGMACIAAPFGLTTTLLMEGPWPFLGFMILLWTNDTGAYLVGRAMGRTKLMPQISPKKTVEGLVGGVLLAMVAGAVMARFWPVLSAAQWIVCAVVVAVAATLGDLLESAFKRHAGVKDSGAILPGHGGILDRFDGFLLALPAMVVCVRCLLR